MMSSLDVMVSYTISRGSLGRVGNDVGHIRHRTSMYMQSKPSNIGHHQFSDAVAILFVHAFQDVQTFTYQAAVLSVFPPPCRKQISDSAIIGTENLFSDTQQRWLTTEQIAAVVRLLHTHIYCLSSHQQHGACCLCRSAELALEGCGVTPTIILREKPINSYGQTGFLRTLQQSYQRQSKKLLCLIFRSIGIEKTKFMQ